MSLLAVQSWSDETLRVLVPDREVVLRVDRPEAGQMRRVARLQRLGRADGEERRDGAGGEQVSRHRGEARAPTPCGLLGGHSFPCAECWRACGPRFRARFRSGGGGDECARPRSPQIRDDTGGTAVPAGGTPTLESLVPIEMRRVDLNHSQGALSHQG